MIKILNSRDLRNGGTLNLRINHYAVIAIRKNNRAFVYLNQCPHLGLPLERAAHDFLDTNQTLIRCANHGALFQIHSGQCVSGPCQGSTLKAIPIQEFDGAIWSEYLSH